MNEIEPIRINNGLLTKVPALFVTTKYTNNLLGTDIFLNDIEREETPVSLGSLMSRKYTTTDSEGNVKRIIPQKLFLPTIIEVLDNNGLKNIGSFSKPECKDAKEACRQNKAIFYPFQQGLIIYSACKDLASILDVFQRNKKELEKAAHQNLKEKIIVRISVLYPIYIEPKENKKPINSSVKKNKNDTTERTSLIENNTTEGKSTFMTGVFEKLGLD